LFRLLDDEFRSSFNGMIVMTMLETMLISRVTSPFLDGLLLISQYGTSVTPPIYMHSVYI